MIREEYDQYDIMGENKNGIENSQDNGFGTANEDQISGNMGEGEVLADKAEEKSYENMIDDNYQDSKVSNVRKKKKKKKKAREPEKAIKNESIWDKTKGVLKSAAIIGATGLAMYAGLNFASLAGSLLSSIKGDSNKYDPSRPETDKYIDSSLSSIKGKVSDEEYNRRLALEVARQKRQANIARESEMILRNQKITGEDLDDAFERNYDNKKIERYIEDDNNIIETGKVGWLTSKIYSSMISRLRDTTKMTAEYARLGASFLFKSFRLNTSDFNEYFDYTDSGLIIKLPYNSYDEICFSIAYLYSNFKEKGDRYVKIVSSAPPTRNEINNWGKSNASLISRYVKSALDSIDFYEWGKKIAFFAHRAIFKNQADAPSYDDIDIYSSPVKLINIK
jgi:hypothetical protein